MHIHLEIPEHAHQIHRYEPGLIVVNQQKHTEAILIDAQQCINTPLASLQDIQIKWLEAHLAKDIEVFIVGTGEHYHPPQLPLQQFFFDRKIGVEFMQSLSACRTFEILSSEKRHCQALIIP